MASLYLILVRWRLSGIIADISLSVLKEKTQFHNPPPPPLLFTKQTDTYHTLDVNKANSDCWTRLSQKQHQDQPGLVVTVGRGGGATWSG